MKTINELQDEIVEEFSAFDDWMDMDMKYIKRRNIWMKNIKPRII